VFRFVPKTRDVRVTIVGEQVFGIAIESQRSPRTRVYWRRYDLARTPHRVIDVPEDIAQRCHAFLHHFRLEFGAFDFAEDEQGRWWFLELNPNGLWAWLELLTGMKMSHALADLLARLNANEPGHVSQERSDAARRADSLRGFPRG